MRRFLRQAGQSARLAPRLDPRAMRTMPVILLLIAAGLTAWVFELGAILQGQAQVRNWSATWVGLDLMEIAGLVLTAALLRRRPAWLPVIAAVTATLFALDGWFDVLTASAGADWYESVAAACFGEIPMTVLLSAITVWAVHRQHRAAGGLCGRSGRPRQDLDSPRRTPRVSRGQGVAAAVRVGSGDKPAGPAGIC